MLAELARRSLDAVSADVYEAQFQLKALPSSTTSELGNYLSFLDDIRDRVKLFSFISSCKTKQRKYFFFPTLIRCWWPFLLFFYSLHLPRWCSLKRRKKKFVSCTSWLTATRFPSPQRIRLPLPNWNHPWTCCGPSFVTLCPSEIPLWRNSSPPWTKM